MAGRVSRSDEHFAKLEAIAVFYLLVFESVLGPAFAADINLGRFQTRAELTRTAHQIGMNMRFEDVRDRHAGFSRHVDVNVAIWARIEHGGNAFIVVTDEIRKFGDARGLDGLENERHAKS